MGNQLLLRFRSKLKYLLIISPLVFLLTTCRKNGINSDYYFLRESEYFANAKYDSLVSFYSKNKIKKIVKKYGELSLEKEFFSNGKLRSYIELYQDSMVGNSYWFYEDGGIRHYNFTNEYYDVCYVMKWDEKGNIVKDDGLTVSPNISVPDGNKLRVHDTLNAWTLIPTPPYTHSRIYAGLMDMRGNVIDSQEVSIVRYFAKYKTLIPTDDSLLIFFRGIMYTEQGKIIHDNTEKSFFR